MTTVLGIDPGFHRRDFNAEARIQAAIVEWVRTVAPGVLIFAVPNGGLLSKAEAARMKWTGAVAVIPNLAVIAPIVRSIDDVRRAFVEWGIETRGAHHV